MNVWLSNGEGAQARGGDAVWLTKAVVSFLTCLAEDLYDHVTEQHDKLRHLIPKNISVGGPNLNRGTLPHSKNKNASGPHRGVETVVLAAEDLLKEATSHTIATSDSRVAPQAADEKKLLRELLALLQLHVKQC